VTPENDTKRWPAMEKRAMLCPMRFPVFALSLLAAVTLVCVPPTGAGAADDVVRFTQPPNPHPEGAPRMPNWPVPPVTKIEQLDFMQKTPYQVRGLGGDGGLRGAGVSADVEIAFANANEGVRLGATRVQDGLEDGSGSPRKILAAYLVQFLLLQPADLVIPTAFLYCVPLERWREYEPKAEPTYPYTDCVLALASFALQHVTPPDPILDPERFRWDPTYAYFLSNFNLVTYLIDHRDSSDGSFLASKDDARRFLFSVGNETTFGSSSFRPFAKNWNELRVPAVRKASIDRLRQLTRENLGFLEVAAELKIGPDGSVRQVPRSRSLAAQKGAVRQGPIVQFGLTKDEIDEVWERIQKLVKRVDSGKLQVF